jgi:non-ribosomal peptide synthetase component F
MTLLAAFLVLLQRYTGQEDISVGTPIAGRTRQELEGIIGFFVNTLVLRTDVRGELTFIDVLERVREAALAAYAHQAVPFEKLVAEVRPARDLSRNPLFQVMFSLQTARSVALGDTATFPGAAAAPVEVLDIARQSAKFDLDL